MKRILVIVLILFSVTSEAQMLLNPYRHTSSVPFVADSIKIHFYSGSNAVGGNWNSVNGTTALTNLKWFSDGSNSGATGTLSAQSSVADHAVGYCPSPVFNWPQGVLRYTSSHSATRTFTISSLPAGTYQVRLVATRSTQAVTQTYSIAGSTSSNNTIAVGSNCGADDALFTDISVSDGGSIVITATNTSNGNNYFTAMVVTRVSNTLP